MLDLFLGTRRRLLAWVFVACVGLMAFALYLQHVVGLVPCPMCIVQRYAFIILGVIAGLAALSKSRVAHIGGSVLVIACVIFGGFVAARQSFLQWNPPEFASCGRDFYGMIETFPLRRVVPMIFQGSGDCSVVDWTFLGLSIANWSFIAFAGIGLALLFALVRRP